MIATKAGEMNARETAAALQCSRSYLYVLMRKGLLHPIEKKTVVEQPPLYFRREEVEALQKARGILSSEDTSQ